MKLHIDRAILTLVTAVTGQNFGTMIETLDDRKKAPLTECLQENQDQRQALRLASIDMRKPLINASQARADDFRLGESSKQIRGEYCMQSS